MTRICLTVDMHAARREAEASLNLFFADRNTRQDVVDHSAIHAMKEDMARRFLDGGECDLLLQQEAELAGVAVMDLAQSIIAKADERKDELVRREIERRSFVYRIRECQTPAAIRVVLLDAGMNEAALASV